MVNGATAAPGKLILTGEYVVLAGAPAIVATVERYARVDWARCAGPSTVVAGELGIKDFRWSLSDSKKLVPTAGALPESLVLLADEPPGSYYWTWLIALFCVAFIALDGFFIIRWFKPLHWAQEALDGLRQDAP